MMNTQQRLLSSIRKAQRERDSALDKLADAQDEIRAMKPFARKGGYVKPKRGRKPDPMLEQARRLFGERRAADQRKSRIEKIEAVAADPRGNENVRAVAATMAAKLR